MTLKTVGTGSGGAGLTDLPAAVKQLQGLRFVCVTGANAGVPIAIQDMDPKDHIVSVINLTDNVNVGGSATAGADQLTLSLSTASKTLLVIFYGVGGDGVTVGT